MIYISNNKKIEYFISRAFEEKDDEIILDLTTLNKKTKTIGKNAFRGIKKFDYLYCKNIETIESQAFKDCSELKEVIFVENEKKDSETETGTETVTKTDTKTETVTKTENSEDFVLNGIKLPKTNNFTIQTLAFENCENLTTIILPKSSKFIIEKNAFKNCSSLRTIVALETDKEENEENESNEEKKEKSCSIFTKNPFEDCPEELVFVCTKDSYVERFARENGYRCINV